MAENVYLFVPNLIGYARVILALISFYYMPTDWQKASMCYFVSVALDAVDGYAARALGQSSRLGAMLDHLTDRCSTLALCMVLCVFYPRYVLWLQVVAVIDIAGHWLHMHSHDLRGSASHKAVGASGGSLLRLYYSSRAVLFTLCAGNEAFFCAVYVCHFWLGPRVPLLGVGAWQLLAALSLPFAAVKTFINLVQLYNAARVVVAVDTEQRAAAAAAAKRE